MSEGQTSEININSGGENTDLKPPAKIVESEAKAPPFLAERFHTGMRVKKGNPTTTLLIEEIKQTGGKIPFSRFMEVSLYGPEGYYSSGKARIGGRHEERVDFTTAPEQSELFGASLGQAARSVWESLGKPEKFRIIEMGAGRGTLADSLLHWIEQLDPEFYKAIRYTILEYGGLITEQKKNIRERGKVEWVQGSAIQMPFANVEGVFISNELPDAFPVDRVTRLNGQIRQKYVTIKEDEWVEVFDKASTAVVEYIVENNIEINEGVEEPINIPAVQFQKGLDRALKRGAIITIDYGSAGKVGVSLPSVHVYSHQGQPTNTFDITKAYDEVSDVDITAGVNFEVLRKIAEEDGLHEDFFGTQEKFLLASGIERLADKLSKKLGETRSWQEVLRIGYALAGMSSVVEEKRAGRIYAFALSKNTPPVIFNMPNNRHIAYPDRIFPKLKLGDPGQSVKVDIGLQFQFRSHLDKDGCLDLDRFRSRALLVKGRRPTKVVDIDRLKLELDRDGCLDADRFRLASAVLMRGQKLIRVADTAGNALLDVDNRDNYKRIVEASGYTFDLE